MLLHQLEIFTKVVENKSFSKAAESLFLSQSTVSTHISNLEKHFNHKLFDRLGKKIVLTPFGERLYPWAKEILVLKDRALWDIKDWAGKINGHLSIAASTVPAQYAVPFLVSRFLKKHQGIEFKFIMEQSGSEKVAEKLAKGEVEIGILGMQYCQEQLNFIPFAEEKFVLITPTNLNLPKVISIADVVGYPFLFRKSDSGTQAILEKMLYTSRITLAELNVIGYFDSLESLKESVREGIGVSIISAIAAADYVKYELINAHELTELPDKRLFYFAHHKKRTLSPLAQAFIDCSIESSQDFYDKYRF